MNPRQISRRNVLAATPPAPASVPPLSAAPSEEPDLAAPERRFGGRIGLHALHDTGTSRPA